LVKPIGYSIAGHEPTSPCLSDPVVVVGVCERLASIRAALTAFAARLDPSALSSTEAADLVRECALVESCAAALKAIAAATAVDGGAFSFPGERTAADALARVVGIGPRSARNLLATARKVVTQPAVSAAARSGRLSREQLAVIADAVAADPGAADLLLDEAASGTATSLRDLAQRVKAAVRDPEAHRRAVHARRGLRTWVDADGVWHLSGNGNAEDGAQVMAAIEPFRERRFVAARGAGRREPAEAYAFDGLVDLAREVAARQGAPGDEAGAPPPADAASHERTTSSTAQGGTGLALEDPGQRTHGAGGEPSPAEPRPPGRPARTGAAVKLLVRIDYDTWLRGVPADGETCELVGYGPIAVSAVRDLVATGDPFVAAILSRGERLVGVAHLGRQPTALQKTALEWLYPSCAVLSCGAIAHLETDHREDWAATHFTALDLLDRLCHHHHGLKTRENWALLDGRGKREFVPPTDPRHPRHRFAGVRSAPPAPAA
jgi:ribosomal protein S13